MLRKTLPSVHQWEVLWEVLLEEFLKPMHIRGPSMSSSLSPESGLVRSLGTFAVAASVVNITIGGGIFRLPADMAGKISDEGHI
jgi:hypothetical protein